ncbi:MAG: hypothetical protein AAF599_16570 [Bacteroidota bacterium]
MLDYSSVTNVTPSVLSGMFEWEHICRRRENLNVLSKVHSICCNAGASLYNYGDLQ